MKNFYPLVKLTWVITIFLIVCTAQTVRSQTYSLSAVQGTFTPLSGGTALNTIETSTSNASGFVDIGFTFLYNGAAYTKTRAFTNGYMDLVNNGWTDYFYPYSMSIAPFGSALSGVGGDVSYKTEGVAPNRVFTMEYLNFKCNKSATQAGISFQVKFFETSNRIDFVYRQEAGALVSPSAFIGITFERDNEYICLSDAGSSPTLHTDRKYINSKPATGQIYRFTPIIYPEPTNHVTGFESFAPGSVSVKWNDATGTSVPSRYLIKASNVGFASITTPVDGVEATEDLNLKDGTGVVYVKSGTQKFSGWADSLGNTTIYMKIFPLTNKNTYTNYKTSGTVPQLQVNIPLYEARKLSCPAFTANSINLTWARGSRSNCIVFVKENATGKTAPVNNTTYTANAVYGSGTEIGTTGWYCVYKGTGTAVNVTGLKPYTSYAVHVLEYNGAAGAEQYSVADEPSAYAVYKTNYFNDIGASFTGVDYSAAAWCDYDNDGDLDFIACGSSNAGRSTILYRNNGANTFVNSGVVLPAVDYSSVSWGDYDNDGFADLIIAGSTSSTTNIAKVFHNNGNGTFSELTTAGLTGVRRGSVVWGDYNNDGFADIFLCGNIGSSSIAKIYMNLKNGSFAEQEGIKLTAAQYSSSLWADFDNDQDLDLLVSGDKDNGYNSILYRNDGNNAFVALTGLTFPKISNASVDVADYDNDGDLDILFTGEVSYSNIVSKIFKNTGKLTFQEQTTIPLTGLFQGSAKWSDVDNDGDMDILLTGREGYNYYYYSKVYLNNSDNTFTEDKALAFANVAYSSVAWGDYDNDADLDLLLTGYQNTSITKVYRNEISKHNSLPGEPFGLISTLDGKVVLKWSKVIGSGVSYNVRVGKTSGAYDVVSPLSSSAGLRRIPAMGNAGLDTILVLENPKKGTYYWSVQAQDFNYAGGSFSPEQTFTFNTDIAAHSVSFKNVMAKSVKCTWSRGNGDKCVLFVKENGSNTAVPVNNTTYTAGSSFGAGTQIGSTGWYCVYNGDRDSITVSNLKPYTQYQFHVIEYTGTAGSEVYYTTSGTGASASHTTSLFSAQNHISMPTGIYTSSSADWGDYDNDGYLDLIYCTYGTNDAITKIFHNNRNNTFTELAQTIPGVSSGNVAWADYDNDGDLDFLLTGYSSSGIISKVFRNNNGIFQDQTHIVLAGVYGGAIAWGDYDNDGYPDILISGEESTTRTTKLYRNTGNNNFVEQTNVALKGAYNGSVAWGDYDNDGFLDILITGGGNSGYFTEIYRNNGNSTFSTVANSIDEVWRSCGIWGDYDNDGDLDILVAGAPNTVTKIYTNNGDGTFTYDATALLEGISLGTVAWGDYDNDGDLDIIESGFDKTFNVMSKAKVYRNNGNKTFTEQTHMAIAGISEGSVIWGDYDNDNDLDIFVLGRGLGKIYKNEIETKNTAPKAPTSLTSSVENDKVVLKWQTVRTDETKYLGLSYNVRIGSAPGKSDRVSGMANDTVTKPNAGYRRVARMGNAQLDTTFIIRNLKKGTYYWSVQAVDNSFAGGTFAAEQSFVFDKDIQASSVSTVLKNSTSVKCNWIRGNGDNCVVFVKENGTGTAVPENNVSYTGNKAFGTGTQIGTTGWFCVYNGVADTATISGLKANTEYRFQVIEYSGTAGSEVYYTIAGTKNPGHYLPPFSEQPQISLTGLSGKTNAWGDYDNDGDLDLILGGYTGSQQIAELHQNNGDNTFTKTSVNLGLNSYDDLQWGDYDNDNDLDLLVLSSWGSKVFENAGSGSFTATATFAAMSGGKGEWADLNNDGYKDVIFTTMSETKVYKNNKDKTFTQQTTPIPGVSNHSSIACGDYDNDGDLDVLVAGLENSTGITKVFTNNGDFSFVELAGTNLPGISNCSVDWADMDNDGDLDIVIAGADNDFHVKIFDNNGNSTFTAIAGTPFKELYRTSLAIADYDNDGYRDLIVSGSYNGNDYYTILYRNNGYSKTYSEVKTVGFPGIQYGSLNWGDYDNDKDLDLFMCGITATGRISKIYKNNGTVFNTNNYGVGLSSYTLDGNNINITWNKSYDSETQSNGLSYNIYAYNVAKSKYAKSGEVFPSGHTMSGRKLVASFGDIQYSANGYTIKGLSSGNYKIAVQNVDAGLLGGNFSAEISFSIYDFSGISVNVANSQILNTQYGMQYSINSTDGVNGTWNDCTSPQTYVNFNTGGFDVWVRQTNNTKINRKVATIAPQAAAPAFTINYTAETTTENVPATMEYSTYSDMRSIAFGADKPVTVTPGTSLYIRYKATATAVPSAVQTLVVAARPPKPAISIDYATEQTVQVIPATMEYSTLHTMANASAGTDAKIGITPGQALYFRTKATASSFCSDVYTLSAPARPAIPYFSFDYINEATDNISSNYEYSDQQNMANAITCDGTKVPVTPGQNLYIRLKATNTAFSSSVKTLQPPARPEAPSTLTVNDGANTLDWNYNPNYAYVTDYEYSLDGGTSWTLCSTKPISVGNVNINAGDAKVRVRALTNRFKGAEASSTTAFTFSTAIATLEDAGIRMFPVPVSEVLYLQNLPENSLISIFSLSGKLVYQLQTEDVNIKIPVNDMPQGMYLIIIKAEDGEYQSKFSKQ